MDADGSDSFRSLYEKHHVAVLGYCLRRSHRDIAPDLASEVFAVAWRRRETMPEAQFVLPWLYAVAARTLSNHRRSMRRRTNLTVKARRVMPGHEPSPELQVVRRSEDEAVIDAVKRLRSNDQELILLSAWEGLTALQLASRFQISHSAAEKRLARAKRRLATELASIDKKTEPTRGAVANGGTP